MEEIIDRGPLFKYTQDYNLNALVSSNFHWTNTLTDAFFDVKDSKTYPARHYDQISVSKSLTYIDILEIVVKYTPTLIYITKPIINTEKVPDINVDFFKLKNLSCFVYFFDIKLDFIIKYFPHIKYLYTDSISFSQSTPENIKNYTFEELKIFCANIANENALNINAPMLEELNLYCWINKTNTANVNDESNIKNTAAQPVINLDKFPLLEILRIDDNIKIVLNNPTKALYSLQFIYHDGSMTVKKTSNVIKKENKLLKVVNGNFPSEYYTSLLSLIKPKELILPPNIFSIETINKLKKTYKIQKIGIYIHENHFVNYFENFPEYLEIYDFHNLHASMSIRYANDLSKYVSRTYSSISPGLDDLILGMQINNNDNNNIVTDSLMSSLTSPTNEHNIVCLTNFDIAHPNYNYKWMYIFNQIETEFRQKPIVITRCEIVKAEKEFFWPSIAIAIKKRVIIMNLQKQSLHLDISIMSINSIINLLDNINGSFPFKILIIVTHGFVLTAANITQIKMHFEDVDITVQDVPYILYS